jgi:pimeloyl-ACP methyl ester carboxylesterase
VAPVAARNPDVSPTDVESLRRHGVEPIILTGVGHFLMLEDPDQFNPLLVATLASFFG